MTRVVTRGRLAAMIVAAIVVAGGNVMRAASWSQVDGFVWGPFARHDRPTHATTVTGLDKLQLPIPDWRPLRLVFSAQPIDPAGRALVRVTLDPASSQAFEPAGPDARTATIVEPGKAAGGERYRLDREPRGALRREGATGRNRAALPNGHARLSRAGRSGGWGAARPPVPGPVEAAGAPGRRGGSTPGACDGHAPGGWNRPGGVLRPVGDREAAVPGPRRGAAPPPRHADAVDALGLWRHRLRRPRLAVSQPADVEPQPAAHHHRQARGHPHGAADRDAEARALVAALALRDRLDRDGRRVLSPAVLLGGVRPRSGRHGDLRLGPVRKRHRLPPCLDRAGERALDRRLPGPAPHPGDEGSCAADLRAAGAEPAARGHVVDRRTRTP